MDPRQEERIETEEEMGRRKRRKEEDGRGQVLDRVAEDLATLLMADEDRDIMALIREVMGRVVSKGLEGEMTYQLGYGKGAIPPVGQANRRNGKTTKTVRSSVGPVEVEVPRDRQGKFEPRLVPKHSRDITEFDRKILSLYGRGMSVRDIQRTLRELYGTEVSNEFISRVTDSIIEDMELWQNRPLESRYYVVYIDALFAKTRESGAVDKRAVYTVVGMAEDGAKDVLGLYVGQSESSSFWMGIFEELRRRGVERIGIVAADGLTGLPQAIEAVFPNTVFQTCVVHLIRGSVKLVPWKDRRAVCADLKAVYTASDAKQAKKALDAFEDKWGTVYPWIAKKWRHRWDEWTPFLALPVEARKVVYTTNPIEGLHRRLRKVIKTRGAFPSDQALLKVLFLAVQDAKNHWGRPTKYWSQARVQLAIFCGFTEEASS